MHIPLCLSRLLSQRPALSHNAAARRPRSDGQVLVIFAISVLVLIFFIGLAVDAGSLYITYGQLKRGIDAAAVSAANTFKRGEDLTSMTAAAQEVLRLQNMDMSQLNLQVSICDNDGDGETDADLATSAPDFYARCPKSGEAPRKLVWVQATLRAPFYFLTLMGFHGVDLSSFSIAEAAPVDLVLVLDVSESMGLESADYNSLADYNPDLTCNNYVVNSSEDPDSTLACKPLWNAKKAASALINNTLYQGYDRVSVITFDSQARVVFDLTSDLNQADSRLWSDVTLHDDPYVYKIWSKWLDQWNYDPTAGAYVQTRQFLFNPVNPEDRDGDGRDADDPGVLGYSCPDPTTMSPAQYDQIMADRWWDYNPGNTDTSKDVPGSQVDPYGWGGVPCDDDNVLDAYDWDSDGVYTSTDTAMANAYYNRYVLYYNGGATPTIFPSLSPLSTCTGCGLRLANNEFKKYGRPGAVWVMVFLSDGDANLSDTAGSGEATFHIGDTPNTGGAIGSSFHSGFCNSQLGQTWWLGPGWCKDSDFTPRYCLYETAANDPLHLYKRMDECPSDSTKIWVQADTSEVRKYSVVDYARDMADAAVQENEMAIYTIGLNVDANSSAEKLLRYIAWVGDDPYRDREDPCDGAATGTSCGQYYYSTASDLARIFDDIASRIYTKISE